MSVHAKENMEKAVNTYVGLCSCLQPFSHQELNPLRHLIGQYFLSEFFFLLAENFSAEFSAAENVLFDLYLSYGISSPTELYE